MMWGITITGGAHSSAEDLQVPFNLVVQIWHTKIHEPMVAYDVPHFCPSHQQQNLTLIHKKKCCCGSCGTQSHIPRDLGGVLLTCALGNRNTVVGAGSATHTTL